MNQRRISATHDSKDLRTGGRGMKRLGGLQDLPDVLRRRDLHQVLPLGRNAIDALLQAQTIPNIIVNRQRLIPRWAVLEFLGIEPESEGTSSIPTDPAQGDGWSGKPRRGQSNRPTPGPHQR